MNFKIVCIKYNLMWFVKAIITIIIFKDCVPANVVYKVISVANLVKCYLIDSACWHVLLSLLLFLMSNMRFVSVRALGLGAMRGRLYVKHPDLFKVGYQKRNYNSNMCLIYAKLLSWVGDKTRLTLKSTDTYFWPHHLHVF